MYEIQVSPMEDKMEHSLEEMIEIARRVTMSKAEEESQRRSFAYGNVAFENPLVTREMIEKAAERILNDSD